MSEREELAEVIALELLDCVNAHLKTDAEEADRRLIFACALAAADAILARRAREADDRPANCRFRLRDEGKAYPRSGCEACATSVSTGLRCPYQRAPFTPAERDGTGRPADARAVLRKLEGAP